MSRFLVLCLVVAVSVSESYAASIRNKRQVIPREFQNINIENYLKNERAVRFQLKCIIDDGPCDRIGKYLKVTIPELLVNQCANCDMSQRERAGKLVSHIQQNFPEEWERAVKKFQHQKRVYQEGGKVKAEDAAKLETVLGVKLDPKLVDAPAATSAAATPETTPVAKAVDVPATSEVSITSTSSATPPATSSSAAPVAASSSEVPAAVTTATVAASSSSSTAPETTSAAPSSSPVPVVASSSAAPAPEAPATSSADPVPAAAAAEASTASPAPPAATSSEAPKA